MIIKIIFKMKCVFFYFITGHNLIFAYIFMLYRDLWKNTGLIAS